MDACHSRRRRGIAVSYDLVVAEGVDLGIVTEPEEDVLVVRLESRMNGADLTLVTIL